MHHGYLCFSFVICYFPFIRSILQQNTRIRRNTEQKKLRFPKRTWHHDLFSCIPHAYSLEKHHGYLCFSFVIFPLLIRNLLFVICYLLYRVASINLEFFILSFKTHNTAETRLILLFIYFIYLLHPGTLGLAGI